MVISKLELPEKREGRTGKNTSRNAKIMVFLDGEYAFPLYESDIKSYGLEEGKELSADLYEKLMREIVFRRSKEKALALLKFMDRTQKELQQRLREELYPEEIIISTLEYVTEYGYLDDERFARNYIRHRKETKSRLILQSELSAKGINREISDKLFLTEYEEPEENPEIMAIRKAINKKVKEPSTLTYEEKQKLMASLYRKGFSGDHIRQALSSMG